MECVLLRLAERLVDMVGEAFKVVLSEGREHAQEAELEITLVDELHCLAFII